MKNILEKIADNNLIYKVQFANGIDATIILEDKKDKEEFDEFLNSSEGDIFTHAESEDEEVYY